jgi:hypothetical protein
MMTTEHSSTDPRSAPHPLTELLRDLREEGTALLRQEVELAKIEMGEKANQFTSNAVKVGIGAGVLGAGSLILLIGLSYLMSHAYLALGIDAEYTIWLGPLTVGLLTALIGWGLVAKARRDLQSTSLAPERTIGSLRDTKAWAQRKMNETQSKSAV